MRIPGQCLCGASMCLATALASPAGAADNERDPTDWGIQLGGPGFFELIYRPALTDWLLLELGGMFIGGGGGFGNASLGTVFEFDPANPVWRPHAAVGLSHAFYIAEGSEKDPNTGEETMSVHIGNMLFSSARVGVELPVGQTRTNVVALDAGIWLGIGGEDKIEQWRFLIPMGGVGYYW